MSEKSLYKKLTDMWLDDDKSRQRAALWQTSNGLSRLKRSVWLFIRKGKKRIGKIIVRCMTCKQ